MRGVDRLQFLHSIATNDFQEVAKEVFEEGRGCGSGGVALSTAFLNGKGMVLEYAEAILMEDVVLLLVESSAAAKQLAALLDRNLFPLDRVEVKDESGSIIVGHSVFGVSRGAGDSSKHWKDVTVTEDTLTYCIEGTNGLVLDGDTYIKFKQGDEGAGEVEDCIKVKGAQATELYEELKQVGGQPSVMLDLAPYNATALEAGMMAGIHFRKGCFVGNEIVSRQTMSNSIRRHLVGLSTEGEEEETGSMEVGAPVVDPETEETVGLICRAPRTLSKEAMALLGSTNIAATRSGVAPALCLLKTKLAERGKKLTVGTQACTVELLQFPQYSTAASPAPPAEKIASKGRKILVDVEGIAASAGSEKDASEDEEMSPEKKEAARKAAKLQAMAARVAALKNKKSAN